MYHKDSYYSKQEDFVDTLKTMDEALDEEDYVELGKAIRILIDTNSKIHDEAIESGQGHLDEPA